jgi:hypothetical protein
MKRVFALGLVLAALAGCATWRPQVERYHCVNTDVYFGVRYEWGAAPSARLEVDGAEPVDLALVAEEPGSYAGHYIYASGDGVRLGVTPDYALLDRPGERRLSCRREVPIIV